MDPVRRTDLDDGTTPRTIVKLDGGHSTLIKGLTPSDVTHALDEYEAEGRKRVFLQGTQFGDNGLVLDVRKVSAIVADRS